MALDTRPRDLESFRIFLRDLPREKVRTLSSYLVRLEMLRNQIQEECPEEVESATAYGSFLTLLNVQSSRPRTRTPRNGLELLLVTTLRNIYEAHELLGEKVLGPVLLEFGRLPKFHIWTSAEARVAEDTGHELWIRAKSEGVTVYGKPIGTDGAGPSLS